MMIEHVFQEIDRIKSTSPSLHEISSVQQLILEQKKQASGTNYYWYHAIRFSKMHNIPLADLLDYTSHVSALTPELIQQSAQELFSSPHHTVFTHLPEAQH
jgi:predicted transcriptional regulator